MARIAVTGAGSAQANGVINCLLMDGGNDEIIGLGADATDLMLCRAHRRYLMPHSRDSTYQDSLLRFLSIEEPDMIHFQHDAELWAAMQFRDRITATGTRMLVPDNDTIDTCVHKYKSWLKFKQAGLTVPENLVIHNPEDLRAAFGALGGESGKIWLRAMSIGGGGKGSLATRDLDEAIRWIERCQGWGEFLAAELLTSRTVTWMSIWHDGVLLVAQSRRRRSWAHSALSPSGVTGVTKVGETCSDPIVDRIAEEAVRAVSRVPNGIYGVDMTYDKNGIPNPTEINISRFFTTIQFFAEAGLNMPAMLKELVIRGRKPDLPRIRNPLPDGLLWLRGMDCAPLLTTESEIDKALLRLDVV